MGIKLAGAMAFLLLVIGGIFYWYYNDTQERMSALNQNNSKLELAVQVNEQTVNRLQSDYKLANKQLEKVNQEFTEIRQQNQLLTDKLSNHSLGNLAQSKPALVEKIISDASSKANRCFELISGAKLTDKEKEATDGKSFNSECPWLFDRYKPN